MGKERWENERWEKKDGRTKDGKKKDERKEGRKQKKNVRQTTILHIVTNLKLGKKTNWIDEC